MQKTIPISKFKATCLRLLDNVNKTGHSDTLDAWRDLLSKGMSLVICKMAAFSESGEVDTRVQRARQWFLPGRACWFYYIKVTKVN